MKLSHQGTVRLTYRMFYCKIHEELGFVFAARKEGFTMLGMKSMRDRWTDSFEKATRLMEKAMELIHKTIDYLGELKNLTEQINTVVELHRKSIEQEIELKKAQTKLVELQIQEVEQSPPKKEALTKKKAKIKK